MYYSFQPHRVCENVKLQRDTMIDNELGYFQGQSPPPHKQAVRAGLLLDDHRGGSEVFSDPGDHIFLYLSCCLTAKVEIMTLRCQGNTDVRVMYMVVAYPELPTLPGVNSEAIEPPWG